MMFATDVDGTILKDNGKPHDETNVAFNYAQSKNNIIVIATGRALSRTQILLEMMPSVDYFVCNNGSLIYDVRKNEVLFLKSLASKNYIRMIKFAKEKKFNLTIHTNKNTYAWPKTKFSNNILITDPIDAEIRELIDKGSNSFLNDEKITQISLFGTAENCKKYFSEIKNMYKDKQSVFLTNAVFIDVNPKDQSKWSALEILAKKLGINSSNIVTFGDSGNDLEMLKKAGKYGFPMENSTDDLKMILKPKIGDNNSNAIANKIIELSNK